MANVKLKELPSKGNAAVNDSDLLLIEDSTDSYSITMRDLKQIFSVDDKLEEMQNYFQGLFDTFTSNIETPIAALQDRCTALETRATSLETDNVNIKKNLQQVADQAILPVGSIYYSYENKLNPNGTLAGTWTDIGYITVFEDNTNKTQHILEIYKRIS